MFGMSEIPVFNEDNQSSAQSRFKSMTSALRANLIEEQDCLLLLHTPCGVFEVGLFSYRIPGFVLITGEDEHKEFRCVVFSEESIRSFPLEVKRKAAIASKSTLGFKPTLRDEME